MKTKTTIPPVIAAFLTLGAISGSAQSFLTNGLVAYYPFTGNVNDASGKGNNGVATAITPAIDRFGVEGNAYQFGPASVITIAPLTSANLPELTLSAWVKPTAFPSPHGSIINKYAAFSPEISDYVLLLYSDLRVAFSNMRHIGGHDVTTTSSLTLNDWTHVAVTLNSAGIGTIWVNGVQKAQRDILPLLPPSTEPVRIGQMVTADGSIIESFLGSIDDVRIYNRAFSTSEIQELYAYESKPACIPHAATATAQVVNGFFVGATITDGGCGYTNAPLVKIIGSGTGASAVAVIENGVVTQINVITPGSGYSSDTIVRIASPPFMPWLEIGVSKVKTTLHVMMGKNYVVEASFDLVDWSQAGPQFTADDEVIVQEFDVDVNGRYFRIRQVP
jgi:hypothetical protein